MTMCFHNKECCSGACYKSICSTEIRLGVPESELTRPSVVNGPYIPVNNLDDLISRFGGQVSTTEQSVKRQERRCKIVGDIHTTNPEHKYELLRKRKTLGSFKHHNGRK
uniref:Uncharacterized protein n=1 Tax=Anopheles culicifacies TaxID=139723 RepID=A0A182LVW8_9DIPT